MQHIEFLSGKIDAFYEYTFKQMKNKMSQERTIDYESRNQTRHGQFQETKHQVSSIKCQVSSSVNIHFCTE